MQLRPLLWVVLGAIAGSVVTGLIVGRRAAPACPSVATAAAPTGR